LLLGVLYRDAQAKGFHPRATDFEERHAVLLHQLIIAAAFLTYPVDREDVVWRFIKDSVNNRVLERTLFAIATLLVGASALICTSARALPDGPVRNNGSETPHSAQHNWRYKGDLLYAIGLASLVPLAGFVILIVGEAVRILRLKRRQDEFSAAGRAIRDRAAATKSTWLEASGEKLLSGAYGLPW